jgi:hypothetical protein
MRSKLSREGSCIIAAVAPAIRDEEVITEHKVEQTTRK